MFEYYVRMQTCFIPSLQVKINQLWTFSVTTYGSLDLVRVAVAVVLVQEAAQVPVLVPVHLAQKVRIRKQVAKDYVNLIHRIPYPLSRD